VGIEMRSLKWEGISKKNLFPHISNIKQKKSMFQSKLLKSLRELKLIASVE